MYLELDLSLGLDDFLKLPGVLFLELRGADALVVVSTLPVKDT